MSNPTGSFQILTKLIAYKTSVQLFFDCFFIRQQVCRAGTYFIVSCDFFVLFANQGYSGEYVFNNDDFEAAVVQPRHIYATMCISKRKPQKLGSYFILSKNSSYILLVILCV